MYGSWARPAGYNTGQKSFFHEKQSRIFVTKYVDDNNKVHNSNVNNTTDQDPQKSVNESDFLNLFYGGDLSRLEPCVRGYKPEGRGTFKVTFYDINNAIVKEFEKSIALSNFEINVKTADNKVIVLKMYMPRLPRKTVTLRPVPIEYDLEGLKPILESWGTPVKITRGLHRQIGDRRRLENEYVHVQYNITDLNENLIPQFFDLEGHYVYVSKPNESLKIQCSYCKGYWHSEELCYKKHRDDKEKKCSYCGETRHTEDNCFRKQMDADQEKMIFDRNQECANLISQVSTFTSSTDQGKSHSIASIQESHTSQESTSGEGVQNIPGEGVGEGVPVNTGIRPVVDIPETSETVLPLSVSDNNNVIVEIPGVSKEVIIGNNEVSEHVVDDLKQDVEMSSRNSESEETNSEHYWTDTNNNIDGSVKTSSVDSDDDSSVVEQSEVDDIVEPLSDTEAEASNSHSSITKRKASRSPVISKKKKKKGGKRNKKK